MEDDERGGGKNEGRGSGYGGCTLRGRVGRRGLEVVGGGVSFGS